jgi:peptidoglycan/xylan/chitin deacetylase (PgdA/CDA1 family)
MLWDVDPRDWRRPPPSQIATSVVGRSRNGSIVLLHTLPGTAAALPEIITGLRNRGLGPVGLPELFRAAGYR